MNNKEAKDELSSTGEYIPTAASHWQIEPFIPVPPTDLYRYLETQLEDSAACNALSQASDKLSARIHQQSFPQHQQLQSAYAALDPDRDTSLLVNREDDESVQDASDVLQLMRVALHDADYAELSSEQLDEALGTASLWGVRLKVDLDIFRHLGVFARGDVVGKRELRRWTRLYRRELMDVEIYRRLIVIFQVKPGIEIGGEGMCDRVYLRMFKNIPKADVDMLLPGTKIQFGWFDHTKILVPSLGGLGMTLWKLARLVLLVAVITTGKVFVLIGLLGATIGYVIRSVMSYFQTKNNYELNLTRSLYFQKLDSNAGVIYRVLEEARHQRYRQGVLAYYALLTCDGAIGRRRLKRRCERLLREMLELEIEFGVDEAIELLQQVDLVQQAGDDLWAAIPDVSSALGGTTPPA